MIIVIVIVIVIVILVIIMTTTIIIMMIVTAILILTTVVVFTIYYGDLTIIPPTVISNKPLSSELVVGELIVRSLCKFRAPQLRHQSFAVSAVSTHAINLKTHVSSMQRNSECKRASNQLRADVPSK